MRNGTPGNIYILSNPSQPSHLKIGRTILDPHERAKDLSRATGVADRFVVEHSRVTSDHMRAEEYVHSYLNSYRTKGEHFFNVGLGLAKDVVNRASELYGMPLTDLENEFDFRAREIYIIPMKGLSLSESYRYIHDIFYINKLYAQALERWGESKIYLMVNHLRQNAVELRFTGTYTHQVRQQLLSSPYISGFFVTGELGDSHDVTWMNQNGMNDLNHYGELIFSEMKYHDDTGIHNNGPFPRFNLPKGYYLEEQVTHADQRWLQGKMPKKFHIIRIESHLCSVFNSKYHNYYKESYNYPWGSPFEIFLEDIFGKCY